MSCSKEGGERCWRWGKGYETLAKREANIPNSLSCMYENMWLPYSYTKRTPCDKQDWDANNLQIRDLLSRLMFAESNDNSEGVRNLKESNNENIKPTGQTNV